MPAATLTKGRLECKNLKADVLSRCGLINLFQLHSKLLHPADKSHRFVCDSFRTMENQNVCQRLKWSTALLTFDFVVLQQSNLYFRYRLQTVHVSDMSVFYTSLPRVALSLLSLFSSFEMHIKEESIITSNKMHYHCYWTAHYFSICMCYNSKTL